MKKRLLALLLFPAMLTLMAIPAAAKPTVPNMGVIFEAKVHTTADGYRLPYRIYVPKEYDATKEYPVLLFMHGAGERGNDNFDQLSIGIAEPFKDTDNPIYNAIVVAPQCPANEKWVDVPAWTDYSYSTDVIPESNEIKAVLDLMESVKKTYNTDLSRYYVSGISMGGYATWDLLVRHPEMFAGAIPVCGGADYRKAKLIAHIPVWTFHGNADTTVPHNGTETMVKFMKAAKAPDVTFTVYEGKNHNIWIEAYSTPGLMEWLFSHDADQLKAEEQTTTEKNTTAQVETTEAVTDTEAVATTEATAAEENSGCGAALSAVAPIAVATGACAVAKKRKKKE